jgi:Tfp pilus assembly protein PilF
MKSYLDVVRCGRGRVRGSPIVGASIALALALTLAACGAKSPAAQAADELALGLRAEGQGQMTQAADHFQKAIVKDPSNKFAYYNLGLVTQLSGQAAVAETNYRAALQIDPNFRSALFNLAIVRTTPSPDEAEQLYRHVIALQPSDAGPHLNLAFLLRSMGRKDEAKSEFARAVTIEPTYASRVPADSRQTNANAAAVVVPSPTPRRSP